MSNKRSNLFRTVHTGMYGDRAMNILGQVSKFCKQSCSRLDSRSFHMMEIERATDNEILLVAYDDDYHISRRKTVFAGGKTDADVRKWLAGCVKGFAKLYMSGRLIGDIHKAEIAKCDGWNRKNPAKILDRDEDLGTVAEYYAAYEFLKGRDAKPDKYPDGVVDGVVGRPFDPIRVELENYRKEETAKIEALRLEKRSKLDNEFGAEYSSLCDKYKGLKSAADDECDRMLAALADEISGAIAVGETEPAGEKPVAPAAEAA